MATKKYNAIARQHIKYNGAFMKTGEKFKVNEKDIEELSKYADIEIPKEAETPPSTPPNREGEKAGTEAGE
ncbi:hypothetical protein [Clostridium kluyveri]|uniref:Uncharacterized protein n=1 Tax=Clostridium kluyveri TaxID=1534 RepID=A0A1L5FBU9_CLOKL|nr:hypothetical protein [Clostridium kluyveri]APM40484.1 hypothetical protein BS101_17990 [Clostridium kluyveri]